MARTVIGEDCDLNVRHTVWLRRTAQLAARRAKEKMFMCQRQSRNVRASGANHAMVQMSPPGLKILILSVEQRGHPNS